MMEGIALKTDNLVRVIVATNADQLQEAFAVRAICFMEDTGISMRRAFDGNDFQATHVVVYAGEEPIGAARIRWFSGFAKIERSAFRKAYRNPRFLKQAAHFIFDHAARKGYPQVTTLARRDYAVMWIRLLGFREIAKRAPIIREGEEYLQLVKDILPRDDAISVDTDPNMQMRIEGAWDVATPFEGELA
jgi:hypothetical protein